MEDEALSGQVPMQEEGHKRNTLGASQLSGTARDGGDATLTQGPDAGAFEPVTIGAPLPPAGVAPAQWAVPMPPAGYVAPYPGMPYPTPGDATPGQMWAAPGYPSPVYAGWPAAPGVPYGYAPPGAATAPTQRKRLSTAAIIGLVAAVLVVCVAGSMGAALFLGPRLINGGLAASLRHSGAPEPTAISYDQNFKDSLDGNINVGWTVDTHCYFNYGVYHVDPGSDSQASECPTPIRSAFYDFDVRVTVYQVSGPLHYGYGLLFRVDNSGGYIFVIDSSGQAWVNAFTASKNTYLSHTWYPSHFARGLNALNTIRIIARGATFAFYVNGYEVGQVTDSTHISGTVQLFSGATNLDAAFTNFELHGNT